MTQDQWNRLRGHLGLSKREADVVRLLLDDHTEAEAAVALGLSAHTVHSYVGRAYRRLGVTSRARLVGAVVRAFLDLGWAASLRREPRGLPEPGSGGVRLVT